MAFIETTRDGRPLYRVRWNYRPRHIDGKPYDVREFRSEDDAREFHRRVSRDDSQITEQITVHEACAHWLTLHVATLERRTIKHYTAEVKLRIAPKLGSKKLASLTAANVTKWRRDLLAEHSPNTANKALATLKAMNRWARGEGLSTNTRFDDVQKLAAPPPASPRPYTPTEVMRIAEAFPRMRDHTLILVAAYTGLRWSELVTLEWDDINLNHPTQPMLEVRRSLDIGKGFNRKTPKSSRSRTVPILDPAVHALHEWREHSTSNGIVFPSRGGNPLGTAWYQHDKSSAEPTAKDGPLGRARKRTGIHIEPHQLRDTFASILIAAGIGEIELSEILAHQTLETTRRRYGRLFAARRVTLASKANDILASLG